MTDPVRVHLYSLSTCYHCKEIRKMLKRYGIPHTAVEVDHLENGERDAVLEKMKALHPEILFPTLVIDDHVISGYRSGEIIHTLEEKNIFKRSLSQRIISKITGEI